MSHVGACQFLYDSLKRTDKSFTCLIGQYASSNLQERARFAEELYHQNKFLFSNNFDVKVVHLCIKSHIVPFHEQRFL